MATAKSKDTNVTKMVEVVEKVRTITLELSEQEAEVLKMLTGSIYGMNKARTIADDIYDALNKISIARDIRNDWDFISSEFKPVD